MIPNQPFNKCKYPDYCTNYIQNKKPYRVVKLFVNNSNYYSNYPYYSA